MQNLIKYLQATLAELKQVSWPTQQQAIMYTALVIGISAVVAMFVGAFDYFFSGFIKQFINSF